MLETAERLGQFVPWWVWLPVSVGFLFTVGSLLVLADKVVP